MVSTIQDEKHGDLQAWTYRVPIRTSLKLGTCRQKVRRVGTRAAINKMKQIGIRGLQRTWCGTAMVESKGQSLPQTVSYNHGKGFIDAIRILSFPSQYDPASPTTAEEVTRQLFQDIGFHNIDKDRHEFFVIGHLKGERPCWWSCQWT